MTNKSKLTFAQHLNRSVFKEFGDTHAAWTIIAIAFGCAWLIEGLMLKYVADVTLPLIMRPIDVRLWVFMLLAVALPRGSGRITFIAAAVAVLVDHA